MPKQDSCFNTFKHTIDGIGLPEKFTFPFYYQPHRLCELAAQELQDYLQTQTDWQHNFGLTGNLDSAIGKMFGVLLVQNKKGELGYLAAFSGKLADSNKWSYFVPPVFDMLSENSFYQEQQATINQLNEFIRQLESNPKITHHQQTRDTEIALSQQHIQVHRDAMIEGRKHRKQQRQQGEKQLSPTGYELLCQQLANESIIQKKQLELLTQHWDDRINAVKQALASMLAPIEALKNQRKVLSASLQKHLFEQYRFLNSSGEYKSISDLFGDAPPAGAGECAAPKLLHYAFLHDLKPLAMAEFWWGASPKSEIRQHKQFYSACQNKCQPILSHMLDGMLVDENPLLTNPAHNKDIDIVYQDDVMVIINKPFDMLSVPGKSIQDCVYQRMKDAFPTATGPLIVHRLDMSTSGLMVIALTKEANKHLQTQFIRRTVKKRYVALLDGVLNQMQGTINLPLRVDLDDRPRQLVCYDYGKAAETDWDVIETKNGQTKVFFYPKTGRTHQLRVHSAHVKGLNMPIVGDDLYGKKANRLHLHADYLALKHPVSDSLMEFQIDAEF
ncbi:MAG: RluA family pseudouridine synthase [Gammaproteobacteria bacterium]|nr:RluA family pseudouridine synthase [Gammaproteobacteria bacterium]